MKLCDTGGSNVQFAINPENGEMIVIEMNPRVSRSSALASKATGFPIAKVAAKLVTSTLNELHNDITGGIIPASFELLIDYVVTKVPRFGSLKNFLKLDDRLTTQMKSVGEVMVRTDFQESFAKSTGGLETAFVALICYRKNLKKFVLN